MLLHVVLSHIVLSQNMFRVMTVQGLWVLYSLITSLLFVGLVLRQADKITNGTSRSSISGSICPRKFFMSSGSLDVVDRFAHYGFSMTILVQHIRFKISIKEVPTTEKYESIFGPISFKTKTKLNSFKTKS